MLASRLCGWIQFLDQGSEITKSLEYEYLPLSESDMGLQQTTLVVGSNLHRSKNCERPAPVCAAETEISHHHVQTHTQLLADPLVSLHVSHRGIPFPSTLEPEQRLFDRLSNLTVFFTTH